ncbi:cellulose binding domain-containing protein [Streptomyces indiaensis]|uniref:cellulose binding domain-containing protein n=1 Tax=Streptomyces indiaensis TaxID=284033 RepID=UPI0035588DA7
MRRTFPDGRRITHRWDGTATQSGSAVSVAAAPCTASIPATGSVTLGFTAARLNGADCSVNCEVPPLPGHGGTTVRVIRATAMRKAVYVAPLR